MTPQIRCRVGITAVECAITLPALLVVMFALLDLGIAATRYNALAEVSRRIAREAILHSSQGPDSMIGWGPDEYVGTAADGSDYVAAAQGMTPTMADDQVNVRLTWPDGDNSTRDRLQVEVRYQHQPLVPAISVWGTIELESVTTMRIIN